MPNDYLSPDYVPLARAAPLGDVGRRGPPEPHPEVVRLEATVAALTSKLHALRQAAEAEVERLTNIVTELKSKLAALQHDNDMHAAEKRLASNRRPPPPPPAPPDRTPEFLAIISKMADRKTPTGIKRTPDGMKLQFDDEMKET
jgi:hypothetical protein